MLEVLWILDQMTSEKKKPLIGEPFMKSNFNMQKISLFHPEKAQSCQTMHLHCCWKIQPSSCKFAPKPAAPDKSAQQ